MRRLWTALCLLTLGALWGCSRTDQPRPAANTNSVKGGEASAEMKWARDVVDSFFTAAKNRQDDQAAGLTTMDATDIGNKLRAWGVTSWAIQSEEMAPDKNEAAFRGTFIGRAVNAPEKSQEFEFVIRVVKQPDRGLWRISFISDSTWGGPR